MTNETVTIPEELLSELINAAQHVRCLVDSAPYFIQVGRYEKEAHEASERLEAAIAAVAK